MKTNRIIFIATITLSFSVFSAEEQHEFPFDSLVEAADKAINERGEQQSFFEDFFIATLPDNMIVDICDIISGFLGNDTNMFINMHVALHQRKNWYFLQMVHDLKKIAAKNISNVTASTIANVEDETLPQPEIILNKIPLFLKKYFMNEIKKNIDYCYRMTLTGHTGKIRAFDLHALTNRAVTYAEDQTIRLWDLLNGGACITVLQRDCVASGICFNTTGSHIATMHNLANGKSRIDQWKITPAGFQFTQFYDLDVQLWSISYFSSNGLIITSDVINRQRNGQKEFCQIIVEFNENGETNRLGSATNTGKLCFMGCVNFQDPYEMKLKSSTEVVVKKKCYDMYLCARAIEKTQQQSALGNITQSQSYKRLIPYEQQMIQQSIKDKVAALNAMEKKEKRQ